VSNRLPQLKAKDIVWVASKLGFTFDRQSGSHAIYYRESDRRRVVVPVHPGKEIKRKTLFGIITDMEIQIEDLRESLK
jgi:predicted RNA binding protein YcfA (HicA-like mRNA interferase family)